jgi:hypothetical protein
VDRGWKKATELPFNVVSENRTSLTFTRIHCRFNSLFGRSAANANEIGYEHEGAVHRFVVYRHAPRVGSVAGFCCVRAEAPVLSEPAEPDGSHRCDLCRQS